MNANPISSTAPANAMPSTDIAARSGWRSRLRRIMRVVFGRRRNTRHRSPMLLRYFTGDSGRIASAGGTATARRTADCAPSAATARLPASEPMATPADRR